MGEIVIQKHSFDLAKKRLREFSEKTEAELEIDKVETDGGFLWLGDHKVTGEELNERLETIQKHLITANTTNNKVIKEFREVYNALDVLDKDYITSILANIKAIEKTSNDVRTQQETLKQHNEKLETQQDELDMHQVEIEKSVTNISKIVTTLKIFKENLEEYKHLADIDKIWNDFIVIQNEFKAVSEDFTQISQKTTEDVTTLRKDFGDAEKFAMESRKLITDLEQADGEMSDRIDSNAHDISVLMEYKNKLRGISHLDDVDSIWKDVEEHTSKITECQKEDENLFAVIQKNEEETHKNIAEATQITNNALESLAKKIKYAYWIAGGSAVVGILEFILLFTQVI